MEDSTYFRKTYKPLIATSINFDRNDSLTICDSRSQSNNHVMRTLYGKKAEKKKRLHISGKRPVVTNALGGEERKKNSASTHIIVQAVPLFIYEQSYSIGLVISWCGGCITLSYGQSHSRNPSFDSERTLSVIGKGNASIRY